MKKNDLTTICQYLSQKDPTLSMVLDTNIDCPMLHSPKLGKEDCLERLMKIIVGQQLSTIAASTIWKRFRSNTDNFNSFLELISSIPNDEKNSFGISRQKLRTLQELIEKVNQGKIELNNQDMLSDNEIYAKFTEIRGIGIWTVDMFLMSCLKRLDVFSEHDAGLVRAISKLYRLPNVSKDDLELITSKWSPYRSIACWFLWRALDNKKI